MQSDVDGSVSLPALYDSHGQASNSGTRAPVQEAFMPPASAEDTTDLPMLISQQSSQIFCGSCSAIFCTQRGLQKHLAMSISCSRHTQLSIQRRSEKAAKVRADALKPISATAYELQARDLMFRGDMKDLVLEGLSTLRIESLVPDTTMTAVRGIVRTWLDAAGAELDRRIAPNFSADSSTQLSSIIEDVLNVFRGLESSALEESYLRKKVPYVQPQERILGPHTDWVVDAEGFRVKGRTRVDSCYDLPLADTIGRLLCHDPRAWENICRFQKKWRAPRSTDPASPDYVIADIQDGSVFLEHPELGKAMIVRDASPDEPIRLAIGLYYDGLETANPLGVARGRNALACFYVTLFNLDPSIRMALPYIIPVTIAREDDIKRYGACAIVSGADREGNIISSMKPTSFGAQMRAFNSPGFYISVPNAAVGYTKRLFRAWCIRLHADFPAAGKLLPFMESTSAHFPSRGSNWNRTGQHAQKPSSFLRQGENGVNNLWQLRTQEHLNESLAKIKALDSVLQPPVMQKEGLNALACAMQPSLVPHFRAFEMSPMDGMHGEPDGLLSAEGYLLVFSIVRIEGWCCLDEINTLIYQYNWPPGHRPPPLHSSVLKGTAGTLPNRSQSLRYTASEMLHWAKHSLSFLRPVIRDPSRLFWRSWQQHILYLELLMQYPYTWGDVLALDCAVYEHQRLFCLVPQYPGFFKPKHAFAQHYAIDTIRCAAMRHNWCMRFEAFNQIVKRIAEGSNYKNVPLRVLHLWSLKSARDLVRGKVADWGSTRPLYLGIAQELSQEQAQTDEDQLCVELFEGPFSSSASIHLSELEAVEYLGDLYTSHTSWVLHQSVSLAAAKAECSTPALARIERLVEASAARKPATIYMQLVRYPHLRLSLSSKSNILTISDEVLDSAEIQMTNALQLEMQSLTLLQHNMLANGDNEFLFIR